LSRSRQNATQKKDCAKTAAQGFMQTHLTPPLLSGLA
jgi:hypothetical protein